MPRLLRDHNPSSFPFVRTEHPGRVVPQDDPAGLLIVAFDNGVQPGREPQACLRGLQLDDRPCAFGIAAGRQVGSVEDL